MTNHKNDIEILVNEIKRLRVFQPKEVSQRRGRYGLDKKVSKVIKKYSSAVTTPFSKNND